MRPGILALVSGALFALACGGPPPPAGLSFEIAENYRPLPQIANAQWAVRSALQSEIELRNVPEIPAARAPTRLVYYDPTGSAAPITLTPMSRAAAGRLKLWHAELRDSRALRLEHTRGGSYRVTVDGPPGVYFLMVENGGYMGSYPIRVLPPHLIVKGGDAALNDLIDEWAGTFEQPMGRIPFFPAELRLLHAPDGAVWGWLKYPTLDCGGQVLLIGAPGGTYHLFEALEYGFDRCIDGGTLACVRTDAALDCEFIDPSGNALSHGSLTRAE